MDTRTAPEDRALPQVRRARALRRVAIGALVVFLGAGALNVFGVRTATVEASGGGYDLSVEYAAMTRPGLATPWSVEITRPGGFAGPVTLSVSSDYLDMFDENGLDPDPSSATADPDRVVWEFEPPDGDTLTVSFDARLEPARQSGQDGVVEVLEDGEPVVRVRFTTRVMG